MCSVNILLLLISITVSYKSSNFLPDGPRAPKTTRTGLFLFVRTRGYGIRTERRGSYGPTRVGVERVS